MGRGTRREPGAPLVLEEVTITMANKDKGETKSSKKKPQKSLKEKRAEKKSKGK
jgi:hypothetical protein